MLAASTLTAGVRRQLARCSSHHGLDPVLALARPYSGSRMGRILLCTVPASTVSRLAPHTAAPASGCVLWLSASRWPPALGGHRHFTTAVVNDRQRSDARFLPPSLSGGGRHQPARAATAFTRPARRAKRRRRRLVQLSVLTCRHNTAWVGGHASASGRYGASFLTCRNA